MKPSKALRLLHRIVSSPCQRNIDFSICSCPDSSWCERAHRLWFHLQNPDCSCPSSPSPCEFSCSTVMTSLSHYVDKECQATGHPTGPCPFCAEVELHCGPRTRQWLLRARQQLDAYRNDKEEDYDELELKHHREEAMADHDHLTMEEEEEEEEENEENRLELGHSCTHARKEEEEEGEEHELRDTDKSAGISLLEHLSADQITRHLARLRTKGDPRQESGFDRSVHCSVCGTGELYFEEKPVLCVACEHMIKPGCTYYTAAQVYRNAMHVCQTADCYHGRLYLCSKCHSNKERSLKDAMRKHLSKNNAADVHDLTLMVEKYYQISPTTYFKRHKVPLHNTIPEPWVKCSKCKLWQHQICVLFYDRLNTANSFYLCPDCCLDRADKAATIVDRCMSFHHVQEVQHGGWRAKDLPRTTLSDHIEQRLASKLKEERAERASILGQASEEVPTAEGLVVRVISSIDKDLMISPKVMQFLEQSDSKFPKETPYRSKMLILFQDIAGVDVCLYAMYVQEYGAVDKGHPNYRYVYLAYLDSVKYFEPRDIKTRHGEALRTFVYHQILIGYLENCKLRGFAACYIWACPPREGDSFIMYSHPKDQKTPQIEKLCAWYQSLINKAKAEGVVVKYTTAFNFFFDPEVDNNGAFTTMRLPFFDGDSIPGEVERILNKDTKLDYVSLSKGHDITQTRQRGKLINVDMHHEHLSNVVTDLDRKIVAELHEHVKSTDQAHMILQLQPWCSHCKRLIESNYWSCQECAGNFSLCNRCFKMNQMLPRIDRHPPKTRSFHNFRPMQLQGPLPEIIQDQECIEGKLFNNREEFLTLCQSNQYQFNSLRRAQHASILILYDLHHRDGISASTHMCQSCLMVLKKGVECSECQGNFIEQQKQAALVLLETLKHVSTCEATMECSELCQHMKVLLTHYASCKSPWKGRACQTCTTAGYILTRHAAACQTKKCKVFNCK